MNKKKDFDRGMIMEAEDSIRSKIFDTMGKFDAQKVKIANLRGLIKELVEVSGQRK